MEKSDSVPFAATLDRSRDYRPKWKKSDKKDKYHIIYMWNLKHDTNEHIYETKKKKDRHREQTGGCQRGGG